MKMLIGFTAGYVFCLFVMFMEPPMPKIAVLPPRVPGACGVMFEVMTTAATTAPTTTWSECVIGGLGSDHRR
jgi:hypothetical protein